MHIFVQKKKKCLRRFSRGHICTHLCKELGACIHFVWIIITTNIIHLHKHSINITIIINKEGAQIFFIHMQASWYLLAWQWIYCQRAHFRQMYGEENWPLTRSMLMFCTEMRSKRFCNGDMFEQARQKGRSDDELTIPSSPKDWKFQFQNMETMTLK